MEAIEASARWFLENGYVKRRRVARVARARDAIRFVDPFEENGVSR
jgi:hypothetical protein